MEIKVIRSSRRLRTVSARLVRGELRINAPAMLSEERLEKIVSHFKAKFESKKIKADLDKQQNLSEIANRLNEKYFGNEIKVNSIEYVTTQNSRFGCCNYQTAEIRISHKIGLMPKWVRDYVIIHEMAHLIEPSHNRAFWDIVSRYKLSERARGFLMAAGFNGREELV